VVSQKLLEFPRISSGTAEFPFERLKFHLYQQEIGLVEILEKERLNVDYE